MKKVSKAWRFAESVILMIVIMTGASISVSEAAAIDVVYEDYDALPVNHVKIKDLSLDECELSSNEESIKDVKVSYTEFESEDVVTGRTVTYHGKVNWGESNTSSEKDAVMKKTEIPGSFSLRFPSKATLSNGDKADVIFEFSDWELWLGDKPGSVSASSEIYVPVLKDSEDGKLMLITATPRIATGEDGALDSTIKQKIKVTMRIVEHGTDKEIDKRYDNMLMGFVDLDVPDKSTASGKSEQERYKGEFTESIMLLSGYSSPLLLAKKEASKVVIESSSSSIKIRGTEADRETLSSGFICPVSPQGYSYNWYGSNGYNKNVKGLSYMGTSLAEMQNVSVGASSGEGGSIEKEGSTDYVLNGTTMYRYKPDPGFYVKTLTVDGKEVDSDQNGGTYTFKKLTATDNEGDDHTIDVKFEAIPKIEIEKQVSNEYPEAGDEIEYTIEIRQTKDEAVLRNAVMEDKIPEGIEVIEESIECSDEGKVTFEDGVITYCQDELGGDAVISFRADVTAEEGTVSNTAVLSGDMADQVSDAAEIKIIDDEEQDDFDKETYESEDDDREHHGGSSKKKSWEYEEQPEEYIGQPEDSDPSAPRTGDDMAGMLALLTGVVAAALLMIRLCMHVNNRR